MIGPINCGIFMKRTKHAENHFESDHFMKNIKNETICEKWTKLPRLQKIYEINKKNEGSIIFNLKKLN